MANERRERVRVRFRLGASARLVKASRQLATATENGCEPSFADDIRRDLHALAGEACMVGFARLSALLHTAEDAAAWLPLAPAGTRASLGAVLVRSTYVMLGALARPDDDEISSTAALRAVHEDLIEAMGGLCEGAIEGARGPCSEIVLSESGARRAALGPGPIRVLVVDDSPLVREELGSLLTAEGWLVETATNGAEALERVRESRHDVVVSDVDMPICGGMELLSVIRAEASDVAFILWTSRGAPGDVRRAIDSGADAYLMKTESSQGKLANVIRRVCSGAA